MHQSGTIHLGHPTIIRSPVRSISRPKTRNRAFKVVRENNGYCVQCTLPIYLPFSKIFKDLWSHAIGRLPPNLSNLSLCQFIWNSHLFYLHNFFLFLMAILEAKNFKIQNFFTSFEKCEQQTHSLYS